MMRHDALRQALPTDSTHLQAILARHLQHKVQRLDAALIINARLDLWSSAAVYQQIRTALQGKHNHGSSKLHTMPRLADIHCYKQHITVHSMCSIHHAARCCDPPPPTAHLERVQWRRGVRPHAHGVDAARRSLAQRIVNNLSARSVTCVSAQHSSTQSCLSTEPQHAGRVRSSGCVASACICLHAASSTAARRRTDCLCTT